MKKRKILMIVINIIIIVSIIAVGLFYTSKSRSFQFFGDLYRTIPNEDKKIALTFDDGPSEHTMKIIDKLQKLEVSATFFLCGTDIAKRPEDAKAIAKAGYGIGNHSDTHKQMILKSYSFCKEEIDKTNLLIRESGYKGEIYFRPPYGKKLFTLPYYLNEIDMPTIMWNIEPETDLGFNATAEDIAENIISQVTSGSIILLHPMYNPENVLAALDIVIPTLKEQGYTFCTLEEMINE